MSLRTCRFETNLHCGMPQKEVEKLQAALDKANKLLKDIFVLSVSEYCKKHNYQNCSCCENKKCGDNTNPIVAELTEAVDALQELHDAQNGPPLIRDKDTWQAAMDRAEKVLEDNQ